MTRIDETFQVNDLIEDGEGDKAIVREVTDDGQIKAIEWNCRPGVIVRPDLGYVSWSSWTNLSAYVRELDAGNLK